MKNMIIKRLVSAKKRIVTIGLGCLVILCAIVLLWFCLELCAASRPRGGELFMPDLEAGVEAYVREGYVSFVDYQNPYVEPHGIWMVSDKDVRDEIISLCKEIKQHRQFFGATDTMLGAHGEFEEFPSIFLVAKDVCYRIKILNWENYAEDAWEDLPIRQERFGKATLYIYRIDLSSMPTDITPYIYAKEFQGADSVNDEQGRGWYSTMPQESMESLLEVLRSIGASNAQMVEIIE